MTAKLLPGRSLALAMITLGCPTAAAAAGVAVALPSPVCVRLDDGRSVVDKEVLATRLLQKYSISVTAIEPALLAKLDVNRPSAWLLANLTHICAKSVKCSKSDQQSVASIDGWMAAFLTPNGVHGFTPPNPAPGLSAFFSGENATDAVLCDEQVADKNSVVGGSANANKDTAATSALSRIQIRSTPDQLGVQNGPGAAFTGTSPASLSAVRDGVAKTSTYKVSGTLGYAVVNSKPDSQFLGDKAILYANVNYSAVEPFKGPSKPASSNAVDLGAFLSTTPIGKEVAISLTFRPDYLWDFTNGSQLITANLKAVPYFKSSGWFVVNDYATIGENFVSIEPTIDFRFDTGRYTRNGSNPSALKSPSVGRLGGQIGLNIVSDNKNMPLSFSSSYTYLRAVVGVRDIGLFSNTLTYSIGAQKNAGVSLIYNNGDVEATAKRENQTSVALTLKY